MWPLPYLQKESDWTTTASAAPRVNAGADPNVPGRCSAPVDVIDGGVGVVDNLDGGGQRRVLVMQRLRRRQLRRSPPDGASRATLSDSNL